MKNKTEICLIDAETSFMLLAEFTLKNSGYIRHTNIVQDWSIYCAAWKFLGNSRVYSAQVNINDITNDKQVCEHIRDSLENVSLLVGHNVDAFDLKKLNTRLIKHNIMPLDHKILTFDTLKAAKKHFKFSSNKLDYLADYLDIGRKLPHTNNDWFKLLTDPDQQTLDFMVKYCKHDVSPLLEGVYLRLKPYVDHPNLTLRQKEDQYICIHCGETDTQHRGTRITKDGKLYQRYKCMDCGGWGSDKIKEEK